VAEAAGTFGVIKLNRETQDTMPEKPAVSVVIATFNRAKFLAETIESILQQSFRDYELLVVDDGSTDDTRALLKSFGDRVRYFCQENRGPSAARNLGVRHARAPWISIQDSDDLCARSHLTTLYRYAQDHPDCGMVFANGAYLAGPEHHRETIIPGDKARRLYVQGVHLADLFDKSIVRLQAALISKAAYDIVGGHDQSLRICMDLDLAFRLCMSFPIGYLDEVVFFYRKHEGNTGRNEELRLTENIQVIKKLLKTYPNVRETLGAQTVARRLAYRYYRLAKGRWKRKERTKAREALREAIALCPCHLIYRLYQLRWAAAEQ
jgi:glycosyltransferase involved in cell wall biosynthesis